MKLPRFVLLPLLLFPLAAPAATSITEDFESYPADSSAADAGWKFFAGNGSLDQLTITAPVAPENTSARCLTGAPDGPDIQIYKPFPAPFDGQAAGSFIDYSAKIFPRASGQKVPRLLLGIRTTEGKLVYLFGIEANDFSTAKFAFRAGSQVSQQFFPVGHLYEVRLRINLGQGLSEATGSLAIKDLSKSSSDWQPVEDLQDLPLHLPNSFDPVTWNDWLIRGEYRREIDDLTLSVQQDKH